MGADIDLDNSEVIRELENWGRWFLNETKVDGFRFDAVKHISSFFLKNWLCQMRDKNNKEFFAVGEYMSGNMHDLNRYLQETSYELSLFDFPLHYKFVRVATSNGDFDLGSIFNETLTKENPPLSVTFVDNHDTQQGASHPNFIPQWFKPLAYALILLRKEGYPCVFYGDYYGIQAHNVASGRNWLLPLLKARGNNAYGEQRDYFDHPDIVGWTIEGNDKHKNSGLAVLLTDKHGGEKWMEVGRRHAGRMFFDCTGSITHRVQINNDGWGNFRVNGGSVSVWLPLN